MLCMFLLPGSLRVVSGHPPTSPSLPHRGLLGSPSWFRLLGPGLALGSLAHLPLR